MAQRHLPILAFILVSLIGIVQAGGHTYTTRPTTTRPMTTRPTTTRPTTTHPMKTSKIGPIPTTTRPTTTRPTTTFPTTTHPTPPPTTVAATLADTAQWRWLFANAGWRTRISMGVCLGQCRRQVSQGRLESTSQCRDLGCAQEIAAKYRELST